MAVDVLKSRGVPENRILFLNLLASPEGIENFAKRFPELRIITAFVDQVFLCSPLSRVHLLTISQGLDEKKYVLNS
jgi:uracil phosphoribosyltransferase